MSGLPTHGYWQRDNYGHVIPELKPWFKTKSDVTSDTLVTQMADALSRIAVLESKVSVLEDEVDDLQAQLTFLEGGVIADNTFRFNRIDDYMRLEYKISSSPDVWGPVVTWQARPDIVPDPDP